MPDHVHLFCAQNAGADSSLESWLRFWKRLTTQNWPSPSELPIWQRSGFNHWLRTGESYEQRWEYVRQNPVRAGLAIIPDDWQFQGELNELSIF